MSSDCINEGYDVTQVIWIQSLIKSRHHPTLGCLRLLYEPTLLYSMAFSLPPLHLSSTLLLLHSGTNLTSVQVLTLSITSKTLSGRIMKKTLNPRLFLYIWVIQMEGNLQMYKYMHKLICSYNHGDLTVWICFFNIHTNTGPEENDPSLKSVRMLSHFPFLYNEC